MEKLYIIWLWVSQEDAVYWKVRTLGVQRFVAPIENYTCDPHSCEPHSCEPHPCKPHYFDSHYCEPHSCEPYYFDSHYCYSHPCEPQLSCKNALEPHLGATLPLSPNSCTPARSFGQGDLSTDQFNGCQEIFRFFFLFPHSIQYSKSWTTLCSTLSKVTQNGKEGRRRMHISGE